MGFCLLLIFLDGEQRIFPDENSSFLASAHIVLKFLFYIPFHQLIWDKPGGRTMTQFLFFFSTQPWDPEVRIQPQAKIHTWSIEQGTATDTLNTKPQQTVQIFSLYINLQIV